MTLYLSGNRETEPIRCMYVCIHVWMYILERRLFWFGLLLARGLFLRNWLVIVGAGKFEIRSVVRHAGSSDTSWCFGLESEGLIEAELYFTLRDLSLLSVFITRPTHSMEGNLLYSVYWFNVRHVWKLPSQNLDWCLTNRLAIICIDYTSWH